MRLTPRVLSLCAVAFLGLGSGLGAKDEAPLSPGFLQKVPPSYRERAKKIRMSAQAQEYYLTDPDADRLESVTDAIAAQPGGIAFLLGAADKETSAPNRTVIFKSLGRVDSMPAYAAQHPESLAVLSRHAGSDPDVSAALAALNGISRIRNKQLGNLLQKRMKSARAHGDQPGLEALSEENRRYQWFGDIPLPEEIRDAPALFAVAPEEKPIRAVAFGDFGTGQEAQVKTAAAIGTYAKEHPFDFGMTLGDNFYGQGMASPWDPRWKTQWEQMYAPLGIKFYASFGNHDYGQPLSPASEIWYSQLSPTWAFPSRYYTFTAGAAQFFALDTVDLTERELRWLDQELAKSKAAWKIVYGHYQIYSASRGDNDEKQDDLIHRLLPILKKQKADLYLCGHDHNLQILKADGGVNFVVAGGGGAGLYDIEIEDYPWSEFKEKSNGFAVVEADRTSLNVRLINPEGKELSALRLKK